MVCFDAVCGALGAKGASLIILGVHKLLNRVPTKALHLPAEALGRVSSLLEDGRMDGWPCSLFLSLSHSLVGTGPPRHSRLDFRGCSIQHIS